MGFILWAVTNLTAIWKLAFYALLTVVIKCPLRVLLEIIRSILRFLFLSVIEKFIWLRSYINVDRTAWFAKSSFLINVLWEIGSRISLREP